MVKLKDIAEQTGVTISTVSAALNGRGNMSPETRERLIEAARRMGYAPNQAARQLRNKPAVDVALVISDSRHNLRLSGTYLVHISEFLDYCRERDLSQRIEFFTEDENGTSIPETIRDRVARGIIHVGFVRPGLQRFLEEHPDYPLVNFGEPGIHCVRSAMESGAYRVVEHLAGLGVKRILVSGGPRRFDYHRQLRCGAERAIRDFGLIPVAREFQNELQTDEVGNLPFMRATVEWARRVLESGQRPEAVFCSGSFPGRALAMVALEKRIAIPAELKIVTVGIVHAGSGSYPELTSLEHNYAGMMREAFGILDRIWDGGGRRGIEILVEPELVVQTSTAGMPQLQ
ncbi:LacI family DNA-binding transcriptional regulator [uncultured Victivallis sp.]|uniref:LacI family DNA-binding transcriptional regulator n=1 Tax=uncultured Victivallis sp. TaxID=354118 RepID=UPI0025D3F9BB|nr:LacI family DNA-binding transcriptional regulator [uncultured Victivallis sp.]